MESDFNKNPFIDSWLKNRDRRYCSDCKEINAVWHLGKPLVWFRCKCMNKRVGEV